MKNVTFKFENGQTVTVNILAPQELSDDHLMAGIRVQQLHVSYPEHDNDTSDPQEWMDDYNEWDIEEGNVSKKETGECTGYEVQLVLDRDKLIETIEEALKTTCNFGWSGWGVPVYLHNDGSLSTGGILSNSSWTESDDFQELLRVETWSVDCSLDQWANDVRENQYTDQDKKILAEIEKLEEEGELDVENLSEIAKTDYENCYQLQMDEDISTACDFYVEKLEREEGESYINYIIE